jgi:hypothetical protein
VAAEIPVLPLPPRVKRVPTGCPASVRFAAWVEAQLAELTGAGKPSPVAVSRAVLRLAWQFYYERLGSEPEHRDRVAEDNGAPCLYGVWLEAMSHLHAIYMEVDKVDLIEKVPVPAPAPEPPPRRQRSVAEAMAAALGLDDVS